MYKVELTKQAADDAIRIERAELKPRAVKLLKVIQNNPYQNTPPYEKLRGFDSTYSRRINRKHRIVYEVLPNTEQLKSEQGEYYKGIVKIIRMWTHYE